MNPSKRRILIVPGRFLPAAELCMLAAKLLPLAAKRRPPATAAKGGGLRGQGLTLLEMLVVLTLLGLLSTALLQGVAFFSAKYEAMQRWRQDAGQAMLQQHWFAWNVSGLASYGVRARRFAGDGSAFAGISLQPLAADPGLPVEARWSISAEGETVALRYRERSGLPGAKSLEWTIAQFDDPALRFQYADPEGRWHDRWPLPEAPEAWTPSAIRLGSASEGAIWLARVSVAPDPLITEKDLR